MLHKRVQRANAVIRRWVIPVMTSQTPREATPQPRDPFPLLFGGSAFWQQAASPRGHPRDNIVGPRFLPFYAFLKNEVAGRDSNPRNLFATSASDRFGIATNP